DRGHRRDGRGRTKTFDTSDDEGETTMTTAADRFTDDVLISWDSYDCYASTAELGLSEVDSDALREMCREHDEDYRTAEAEVLAWVRHRTAELTVSRKPID